MGAIKSATLKRKLGKRFKSNKQAPHWIRLKGDIKVKYNYKRRHWRRTKLGL